MKNKITIELGIFFLIVIFLTFFVSAAYMSSSIQYSQPGAFSSGYGSSYSDSYLQYMDSQEKKCGEGQNFVLQINPFGCTPAIVRSDLLEDQNVPVFCQLVATNINPLVDVEAIDSISFSGDYPEEVSGVGFHPARAALGVPGNLNSPAFNNIGYAVIVLKRQENESSMPDWVEGTMTAKIRYDIQNAFGVGRGSFYLPVLSDEEWSERSAQYSFWNGKGYLRADEVDDYGALVSLYSMDENNRLTSVRLNNGQTSQTIYLPGFDCMAGLQLRLDGLQNPGTRARLRVNSDIIEVADGEEFLENRCRVTRVNDEGLIKGVSVSCKEDTGSRNIELRVMPGLRLDIDGVSGTYEVGDKLYDIGDGRAVYLGYAGSSYSFVRKEDVYVDLIIMPDQGNKLNDVSTTSISNLKYSHESQRLTDMNWEKFAGDFGSFYAKKTSDAYQYIVDGKSYNRLNLGENKNVEGKNVYLLGFATPENTELEGDYNKNYYDYAMEDFETVKQSFPGEKINPTDLKTFGQLALYEQIVLAKAKGQRELLNSLCMEYRETYPNSEGEISSLCGNDYLLSSSSIASETVVINRNSYTISFEGIYQPSIEDYSAEIMVSAPGGGVKNIVMRNNQMIYLGTEASSSDGSYGSGSGTGTGSGVSGGVCGGLTPVSAIPEQQIADTKTVCSKLLSKYKSGQIYEPTALWRRHVKADLEYCAERGYVKSGSYADKLSCPNGFIEKSINTEMLKELERLSEKYKVKVGAIAGGNHNGCGSAHYTGNALDVSGISGNGVNLEGGPRMKEFLEREGYFKNCQLYTNNIPEKEGGHAGHVHVSNCQCGYSSESSTSGSQQSGKILFFGDSLTNGLSKELNEYISSEFISVQRVGSRVSEWAEESNNCYGGACNLNDILDADSYNIIFISLGTNDCDDPIEGSQIRTILNKIEGSKSKNARCYWVGPAGIFKQKYFDGNTNPESVTYCSNAATSIKNVLEESSSCTFIDSRDFDICRYEEGSALCQDKIILRKEWNSNTESYDYIHPTAEGYAKWAEKIYNHNDVYNLEVNSQKSSTSEYPISTEINEDDERSFNLLGYSILDWFSSDKKTVEGIASLMKSSCECGDDCYSYAQSVVKHAKKYNIDPVLLVTIMKLESGCKWEAVSPAPDFCVGLMQICSWEECKKRGMSINSKSDLAGKNNYDKNIQCGAIILRMNYDLRKDGIKRANGRYYTEWDAALAGYVGLGSKHPDYVEKMIQEYNRLQGIDTDLIPWTSGTSSSDSTWYSGGGGGGVLEYVQLTGLEDEYALFKLMYDSGLTRTVRLQRGVPESFGSSYAFTLRNVNLKKSAKVSVIPTIDNTGTDANFTFRIGIEKRSIQLSPAQIRDKMKQLDEMIARWQGISDSMGNLVETFKTACLTVGFGLAIKNFVTNTGGKAIARQEVMNGYWYDYCNSNSGEGKTYYSQDKCLFENSPHIDKDVNQYYTVMQSQQENIKSLQKPYETEEFLGKQIDDSKFKPVYEKKVGEQLISEGTVISVSGKEFKTAEINSKLKYATMEDLREIQASLGCLKSGNSRLKQMCDSKLSILFSDLDERTKNIAQQDAISTELESYMDGKVNARPHVGGEFITTKEVYDGIKMTKNLNDLRVGDMTQVIIYQGTSYILKLNQIDQYGKYGILGVYSQSGIRVSEELEKEVKSKYSHFQLYDQESYRNLFKSVAGENMPMIKYYETAPYAGLPAIVPYDLERGWYAYVKQTIPVTGNMKSYDESGRVSSFYVCNVGANGIAEFNSGIGDDACRGVNLGTGQTYREFDGLSEGDAARQIRCAQDAIEQASRAYKPGLSGKVRIRTSCGSYDISVGKPAADTPDMQCTNFMSPKECQILFNVCDPVICPSSRCDFGGAYPVRDVIQSGIVGSIALCLPNLKEGIYIPVCLTGIKAGVDGLLSVMTSYKDCLNESLETGKMVGICDEIYSIHLCEFFWRQVLPLTNIILPKMIEFAMGQNIRGGGEYLGVMSAWENAEKSLKYFTEYYTAESWDMFKSRVVKYIGESVCQNFLSISYPDAESLFDSLTKPDSPPQFHGWFHSNTFTTATNPPLSHYKVFYHIYAGEESRAFYSVYLKGSSGGSYYQDTSLVYPVASGYIATGGYASETKDFTAPEGYTELCIDVNGQEECDFKQVSTSFAVNYVNDKYMEEQASERNIKTETDCVAGTPSAYSLVTPNIQEGLDEVINPEIYKRGLIRICATGNPGQGTDPYAGANGSRWVDVGYCDETKLRCWLDTDSVKEVIKNTNIEGDVLQQNWDLQRILQGDNYLSEEDFSSKISSILSTRSNSQRISLINSIIGSVFYNNQKAYLYYLRGIAYSLLARGQAEDSSADNRMSTEEKRAAISTETPVSTTGSGMSDDEKCLNACIEQGLSVISRSATRVVSFSECKPFGEYTEANSLSVEKIICCCYRTSSAVIED